MDIEDKITLEDMPNDEMRDVYEHFGKDVAVGIMKIFQGQQITFPLNWIFKLKRRLILENPDHLDIKGMIRTYKVSKHFVYSVLRNRDAGKQMTLLEDKE